MVVSAIRALLPMVVGKSLLKIYTDFGSFWRALTNESQLRWIGPDKGAVHLAVAAVINALWDLWGKIEQKPVWKLLCDMTPEEILTLVDFGYLSDVLTKEDARQIFSKWYPTRSERETQITRRDTLLTQPPSDGWGICGHSTSQGFILKNYQGWAKVKC